jgi:excisionase family DNA binding protein
MAIPVRQLPNQRGHQMTIDSRVKPSPPDQLFDIMDVASAIGACRGTVREILSSGQLKAVRLGGKTKIRRSEPERFLESLPEAKFGEPAQGAGAHGA